MGDGAVKTGSKKSADEMDKKKKVSQMRRDVFFFVANTADESSPP